jgi:hypothetical protein
MIGALALSGLRADFALLDDHLAQFGVFRNPGHQTTIAWVAARSVGDAVTVRWGERASLAALSPVGARACQC